MTLTWLLVFMSTDFEITETPLGSSISKGFGVFSLSFLLEMNEWLKLTFRECLHKMQSRYVTIYFPSFQIMQQIKQTAYL